MDWVRAVRPLSFMTAALLALAALWYALYIFGVTTPAFPASDSSLTRAENLRTFFIYQHSVVWQEYGFTLLAALAFLLVAPIAMVLREILGHQIPTATIASAFFIAAACLLVAGQVVQIGTQRAFLSSSGNELNDTETLILIWDTGLFISNWLENGGYFSPALGILGWAVVGREIRPVPRAWITLSGILSAALLIVVVCQALEVWVIYDVALALSGAVLAPAWFLLTAQVCTSVSEGIKEY